MKLSELIMALLKLLVEHGDLPVIRYSDGMSYELTPDEVAHRDAWVNTPEHISIGD